MGVRQLREAAGLQQTELAKKLCVKQSSVCDWERGRTVPTAENAMKMADIFGCTLDAIFDYQPRSSA